MCEGLSPCRCRPGSETVGVNVGVRKGVLIGKGELDGVNGCQY